MKEELNEVLEVAAQAGHILLENGAEISRVEDIMGRIATHFGVHTGNFFVLSNGIFTTGSGEKISKAGGQASTYANVEFIPIRSINLSKVVAVNRLSYDIAGNRCTLVEARERLAAIKASPSKPALESIAGSALGAAGFCAVFGGSLLDCAAALVAGALLELFILLVSGRYLSKIVGGICNAVLVTLLCIAMWRLGFGESLSNIIIGAVMPLIPGVPFVNGVRDLANSDYIAGLTRLTDAMLSFFCIALGVIVAFTMDGAAFGGMIALGGMTQSAQTAGLVCQFAAAFVGTFAFAILFGMERGHYAVAGAIGALGWLLYLVLLRYAGAGASLATLASAVLVCVLSRAMAVPMRSPAQVFLLCGLFPLIPGAGIFWFTYYLSTAQFHLSLLGGFTAVKTAISIVLGIILAMELPQRIFSGRRSERKTTCR